MGLGHNHESSQSGKNILLAFTLNFSFSMFEFVGGFITGSTAIMSDAVHDLGDSVSLAVSYILFRLSKSKSNPSFTYGYKRLSVIGAILNITVLSFGTYLVLQEAIEKLFNPEPVLAQGMIFMAILGISINGISVYRMKGTKRLLDRTVVMHLLEDFLGWIAVFFVSIIMMFTDWYILDPILSILMSIIVIRVIFINIKQALSLLMCAVPDRELYETVKSSISTLPSVISLQQVNMWSLDGDEHVFTATILVESSADSQVILNSCKAILDEHDIHHSTIELQKK